MAGLCTCEDEFGNTGISGCELIASVGFSVVLQSMYGEDGERNFIDVSDPDTVGATVRAMTTAAEPSLSRLYPLPVAENVTQEKTATAFETAPSNRKYRVQEGIRTILLQFLGENSSVRFLGELNKFGCSDLQYYLVDGNGNLWGTSTTDGELYGIPLSASSFDTMLMMATDTTVQKIQLQFDVEYGFDDSTLRALTSSVLGYSATTLRGLVSVFGTVVGNPTTTTAVIQLNYRTNSATAPNRGFTGLVTANFALREVEPTPATIAVTASEDGVTSGLYTLTYATQTSGDVLEVTATRAGYEVIPVQFTIP